MSHTGLKAESSEDGLGVVPGIDEHRDHDGAHPLAWCLAYGPADSLDDVDLGVAGSDEGDTVQGGHVHPL